MHRTFSKCFHVFAAFEGQTLVGAILCRLEALVSNDTNGRLTGSTVKEFVAQLQSVNLVVLLAAWSCMSACKVAAVLF